MANIQTIQKFYSQASARDFARAFQFRLTSFGSVKFSQEHLTYVETATLPGRSINSVQVPYMGLQFNVPGTASYPGSNAYNVVFRCDQKYNLRSVLESSLFGTFDENSSTGEYNIPGSESTMTLELLDKKMEAVRYYTLFGVYLQSLGDTGYDIKDNGTVVTIQAVLAYQFWRAGSETAITKSTSMNVNPPSWTGR